MYIFKNYITYKPTECLTTITKVNIIDSNGNKYVFNNANEYNSNLCYGLNIGTYYFKDVPSEHPMAILVNDSNIIEYTGENFAGSQEVNGANYNHYYGNLTVNVKADFGTTSVHCYNHGFMGGENLLKFKLICNINTSASSNSGTTDSGTTDSGTTGSGTTDSGTTDSGTTDSGTTDSGTTDSGTTDSGTTNSGTTNSGTTNSGY